MLYFWLMMLVVTLGLIVLLWVGALFFQGYFYTEPAAQIVWGAPAAGVMLGGFLAWWLVTVVRTPETRPEDIPYDTIFRFSPRVYMVNEPVKQLWAVKKNNEKVLYERYRLDQRRYEYKDVTTKRPWNGNGVEKVEIVHNDEKYVFEKEKTTASGAYQRFVNDKGWSMSTGERGISGEPTTFRTSRFLANLFFNFTHLALWFAGLWLLLRFQWTHALGLAFCLWLLVTLAFMPMMLGYAAELAQTRTTASLLSIWPAYVS
ncbi:MAG: alkaline shock response membrane anchor protein AmaP [Gemmataceae bacterium]|nr:alkaline shock response membrane anchor protein AmaP [Gemmataceae bacterium]